jgi:hypothetical protein
MTHYPNPLTLRLTHNCEKRRVSSDLIHHAFRLSGLLGGLGHGGRPLLIQAVHEHGGDQEADDEDVAEQELEQALEGLGEAADGGADGGEGGADDAQDEVDEVVEEAEDALEDAGDGAEDGGDEVADGVGDGRHGGGLVWFVVGCGA